ncbi:L,D-transpeptidase [Mesorhizobium sp. SB112]|uniref:L,D-transpeptidase family protein n=1 Tax=Mesorhizobium sp. SB112 TaxID=3151853 RepID=UPI0032657125
MHLKTRFLAMLLAGAGVIFSLPAIAQTVEDVLAANSPVTPESINAAPLVDLDQIVTASSAESLSNETSASKAIAPSASIVRLQILLDRAGASPGVIDGLDGGNLRKAISGFRLMLGLPVDGKLDPAVIAALISPDQAISSHVISPEDHASVVGELPEDYGELAKLDHLGYTSVAEGIAERFHMDVGFLRLLNPGSDFASGETIFVADPGSDREGQVAKVEVDKPGGQVRAYAANGFLIATYPATIGSESNPSPKGTHMVKTVVENPTYTYNPKLNFQQGNNDKVLTLPPGPNGPVGSIWIDLSEPTYGIHGTPEPNRIDKTGSHGCVRITNWDAQELAKMLTEGVPVIFLE